MFETDVPGVWGLWPTAPALWSYSSLEGIEACPRKWMLSRADYPDIWHQGGYPRLPVVAAIFGNVVHGVAERLAAELGAAGITSPGMGDVVGLLSSHGGWRGIVLDAMERELSRFSGNPRVTRERIERVRDELVRRVPEAADQVKLLLGHGPFPSAQGLSTDAVAAGKGVGGSLPRTPAGPGAHVEREMTAASLRLTGRIDLLVVDDVEVIITDFKTGLEQASHDDQVRLYALLWHLDAKVNPTQRLATKLRVVFPTHEHSVVAPDRNQLQALESATAARIEAADAVTRTPPPTANPSQENCQHCNVRHLCDSYWSELTPTVATVSTEQWLDFEGRILRKNGAKSWFAEAVNGPPVEVLMRTVAPGLVFQVGRVVRLLGVRRSQDPDDAERIVVSMVATSEWYALARS